MKRTMQMHSAFKPLVAAAVGGWLAMSVATASAQMTPQTADMSVTGTIVPAACSANFTGGGTVDFGTIRLIDLPANAYYSLGDRNTALNVICNANKRVNFSVQDMQSASRIVGTAMQTAVSVNSDQYIFGLGATTVNSVPVNIGGYSLTVSALKVDNVNRAAIYSLNNGSSWNAGAAYLSFNDSVLVTAGNGTTPVAGAEFNFPLKVTAALNYGSRLQVAQDTPLNGQAVFSIRYQ